MTKSPFRSLTGRNGLSFFLSEIPLGLRLPQPRIRPVLPGQKLLMAALLHQSAFLKHRDGVAEAAGGQAVGNIERAHSSVPG